MTLGFSTKIKNKLTHFPEKIIRSLDISEPKKMTNYDLLAEIQKENEQLNIHEFQKLQPKLHTIREDKKDRWKVGNDIHFVINNRTKNRFQFAPILKVKSIQRIAFLWRKGETFENFYKTCEVIIEKKDKTTTMPTITFNKDGDIIYCNEELEKLAVNDGFENVKYLFDWFKYDFEGKIIHWTDYSY